MTTESTRLAVRYLKERFITWRTPPVDLPAESVIEEVVTHIQDQARRAAWSEAIEAAANRNALAEAVAKCTCEMLEPPCKFKITRSDYLIADAVIKAIRAIPYPEKET